MTAPAQNLTARQHRLLVYLHARAPEVPSIREMSDAIGVVSSNATGLLLRLERDGWIRRARGKARAVELLRPPPAKAPLTPKQGLAFARAWRIRMKPYFDALYGQGAEG